MAFATVQEAADIQELLEKLGLTGTRPARSSRSEEVLAVQVAERL